LDKAIAFLKDHELEPYEKRQRELKLAAEEKLKLELAAAVEEKTEI
jgi:hypothetical protein